MAHGDAFWFPVLCWPFEESMATLGDTSGSNAKLPVESRILIFGPWHPAIWTI